MDIDAPKMNGVTPLYMSCLHGHTEVVKRLLTAGGTLKPVDLAIKANRTVILALLSGPLPEDKVATHQMRFEEIRVNLQPLIQRHGSQGLHNQ